MIADRFGSGQGVENGEDDDDDDVAPLACV